MKTPFLTPNDLANRWNLTQNTLMHWRWSGRGPLFLKIGGRVLYRIEDIEQFEREKVRQNTSQTQAPEVSFTHN
jgi:predicted site-specific integrase-resolvase